MGEGVCRKKKYVVPQAEGMGKAIRPVGTTYYSLCMLVDANGGRDQAFTRLT